MCPDSDVKLQRRSELSVWDCGERERDATPARPGAVGHDRDGESSQEKHELSGGASTTDWAKQKLWGKSKGACKSGVYRKAQKARLRNGFFFVDLCFLFSLSSLPPSLSRKFGARHREGSKAGRFVPGRPTASGGWSGLSLLLNRIMLVRAFFFTTAKCHSATLYGNAGKTNRSYYVAYCYCILLV